MLHCLGGRLRPHRDDVEQNIGFVESMGHAGGFISLFLHEVSVWLAERRVFESVGSSLDA